MRFQSYILTIGFIFICTATIAQNTIQLIPQSSSIRVFGTSNIHDWEMHVELQTETPDYIIPNNSLKDLKDVQFKIEGVNLKSEESAMQKKAHKALNLKNYPHISFLLKNITIKEHKANHFFAHANGTLLISGESREIKLPLRGNFLGDKKMNLTGHIDLKMSDFKVEAPTALFGAISTADEIKILYSLDFSSKQKLTPKSLSSNLVP